MAWSFLLSKLWRKHNTIRDQDVSLTQRGTVAATLPEPPV